jgi:hypothetical protein
MNTSKHTTMSTGALLSILALLGTPALARKPAANPTPTAQIATEAATDGTPEVTPEVTIDIEVGEPVMLAGQDHKAYVKISLAGFDLPKTTQRPGINLALVLD